MKRFRLWPLAAIFIVNAIACEDSDGGSFMAPGQPGIDESEGGGVAATSWGAWEGPGPVCDLELPSIERQRDIDSACEAVPMGVGATALAVIGGNPPCARAIDSACGEASNADACGRLTPTSAEICGQIQWTTCTWAETAMLAAGDTCDAIEVVDRCVPLLAPGAGGPQDDACAAPPPIQGETTYNQLYWLDTGAGTRVVRINRANDDHQGYPEHYPGYVSGYDYCFPINSQPELEISDVCGCAWSALCDP